MWNVLMGQLSVILKRNKFVTFKPEVLIHPQTARSILVFSFGAEVLNQFEYPKLQKRIESTVQEILKAEGAIISTSQWCLESIHAGIEDERILMPVHHTDSRFQCNPWWYSFCSRKSHICLLILSSEWPHGITFVLLSISCNTNISILE